MAIFGSQKGRVNPGVRGAAGYYPEGMFGEEDVPWLQPAKMELPPMSVPPGSPATPALPPGTPTYAPIPEVSAAPAPSVPGGYNPLAWQYFLQGNPGSAAPFGPDRPGESRMYNAGAEPLNTAMNQIRVALGNAPTDQQIYNNTMGMAPGIQDLFRPDASTQGQLFTSIMNMLRPQQQQQVGDLSNQLAATGLGGGRAARAFAEQQRGFGAQASDVTNQLLQGQLTGQQSAAQIISSLLGQNLGSNSAMVQQLMGMIPGLAVAKSQLAPTILDVFQNRNVQ